MYNKMNSSNIKINGKYVNYVVTEDGLTIEKPVEIKTDWIPTYYNEQFQTISVPMKKDDNIYNILKHIDEIIAKELPPKCKQTKILKEYNDKYSVKPKYEFAKIYDENKKQITIKALQKRNIECRFIFTVSPIKLYKSYYGSNLKCVVIQVRDKKIEERECLFDD